eukprot:scpid76948/ scgid15322/ Regulator of microtubule dynamics protein 1; Protein FAM82B
MACQRLCNRQLATLFQRACRAASEAALSSPTPATPLLPTPQSVACTRPTGVRAIHLQTSAVNGAATAAARAEHAQRSTTAQQGSRGGHWEHSRNGGGSGDGGGRSDWKPWSAASCLLLSWTPITLIGFSNEKNSEQGEESTTPVTKSVTAKELKKLVTEADQLHRAGEYHKEYELLFPYHACEEAEVLWRLSRLSILCRDTVMRVGGHYESCTRQALRLASAARTLAPQNAMCHLWFGISMNHMQNYRAPHQKLTDVGEMFNSFKESIRLNPNLAYAWHCLGQWHFHVAQVGWLSWQAVSYANPNLERGSFEGAKDCFLRAEELNPGFYLGNLNYLAWTYEQLGETDKQIETLKKVVSYEADDDVDDENIHEAAMKLESLLKPQQT